MNAEVLRLLLAVSLIAMYVIAMLYLRRRRLGLGAYLFWGLFALSIPALGPFLVILTRPGSIKHNPQKNGGRRTPWPSPPPVPASGAGRAGKETRRR
jgi:hypothetical protein